MVTVLPALTSCSTDSWLPAESLMIKLCGVNVVTLVSVSSTGFPASTIKWFGVIGVAIKRDRGSLHPVCRHWDYHRRAGLRGYRCVNDCHADRCQQPDSRQYVEQ